MKTSKKHHLIGALLAAICASNGALCADNWNLTDNWRLNTTTSGMGASAGDITTDPTGRTLFTVGSAMDFDATGQVVHNAIIRQSTDAGTSWETVDSFLEPDWRGAHWRGVASTSFGPSAAGSLYVCGNLFDPTTHWIVRRHTAEGWETVDLSAPTGNASASDIKVGPTGEVYAAGYDQGWTVRKSLTGDAETWETVDFPNNGGEALRLAFDLNGHVYAVGRQLVTVSKNIRRDAWTVRRNDGSGWKTVDTYQETSGQPSGANSIAVDHLGNIYVAGYARGSVTSKGKTKISDYWVVRRSSSGNAGTWQIVDKETAPSGGPITPGGIVADASGNIWVSGWIQSPMQWIVRKGLRAANGSLTWSTSDLFSDGNGARANGITADAFGNVIATGRWVGSDNENWWTTRKIESQ